MIPALDHCPQPCTRRPQGLTMPTYRHRPFPFDPWFAPRPSSIPLYETSPSPYILPRSTHSRGPPSTASCGPTRSQSHILAHTHNLKITRAAHPLVRTLTRPTAPDSGPLKKKSRLSVSRPGVAGSATEPPLPGRALKPGRVFPEPGAPPGVLRSKPRLGPGPARPVGCDWPERGVGHKGACLGRGEERRWD